MLGIMSRTVAQLKQLSEMKKWGGYMTVIDPGKEQFDPFLFMVDHDHNFGPDENAGFPPHPHRGFETVTYVLEGGLDHGDSAGNSGTYGPGDVQWMTAGRGVLHSEMFVTHPTQRTHHKLFQLWINLPARLKMCEPGYEMIWNRDVPRSVLPGGGVVRVIAGAHGDARSRIQKSIPLSVMHATLPPGERVVFDAPAQQNALIYVFGGAVVVAPAGGGRADAVPAAAVSGRAAQRVGRLMWAVLRDDGDRVELQSVAPEPAEVIFLAGQPLREPIAQRGPFVMNTPAELQQAMVDVMAGRFGHMEHEYRPPERRHLLGRGAADDDDA